MREFAKKFYNSQAWQNCREAYIKSKGGLCERCYSRGRIVPADTVHHIKHLTPNNIDDPSVTLAWSNLQALCRDCHAEMHSKQRRYKLDAIGRVIDMRD